MSYTQPPGRPSPGQTCRLILVFTVLLQVALQSFSGAVTYLYFTHQLKQYWGLNSGLHTCKTGALLLEPNFQLFLLWLFCR
uniref:Tumor necrosis factor ligand superfamily member 10-like isoform X3 n=1 Tax=Castor canadensis TaxID=51338 RepID=A0A8B7UAN5_CASCN|nr:tumor necrosis factor ligand superfamily member 10-like isoform X3 [Castor canadensis]